MKHVSVLACVAAMLAFGAARAEDAAVRYKVVPAIPLGDGERWDYASFDPSSGRVFVAHGDHVTAVDPATGTIAGQIGPLPGGTHGIAFAPQYGWGYTDDGKAGTVAVFDLKTFKIVKTLPAAPDADGIVSDPASGHIFVINGDSGSVTVIDPKSNIVVATIAVRAGLEAAIPDGKGNLFVDGAEAHDIVKIDTQTNAVTAHYPMPGCQRPHGIAVDAQTRRVFATCVNKVMIVVDADSGANVATVPIGGGSDGAVFDPARKLAVSSNGEGTVSIVQEKDANTFVPLPSVTTAQSARTIAIDSATGRLFLPAATISKIDPPDTPGGRPHVTFVPGSLKLMVFAPQP